MDWGHTTISPHIMVNGKYKESQIYFSVTHFISLNSSKEGVELVKIRKRHTLILRAASYGYEDEITKKRLAIS